MATYRTIRMAFWSDPYIETLSASEKLLYLYLFSCPHTNNLGLLAVSRRRMAYDTGLTEEAVDAALAAFERDRKIVMDGDTVWLCNFIRHQCSTSPKILASLRALLPAVESADIRAYGYGETEESWLVASGSADNLAALEEILFGSVYADPDGREYVVKAAMIDAMGGRTAEVYRWAVRHRGRVFPWQGVRSMAQPYTPSHQEYFPDARGNKVKIPGGLMLYRCDVTFFKSDLAFKLGIHPDDPGAFHLHANDGGQLEQYAKELCAEVWDDEKQGWENPANKPNHFWDCEVMQRALAYILNVRHRRRPDEQQKKPARPPRPAERGGIGSRPAGLRRY